MGVQLTGTFKQGWVSKKAVVCSKILGERLIFDISSPLTQTFHSKKYWFLAVEDSIDECFFKMELKNVMMGLIKSGTCNAITPEKMFALKGSASGKGLGCS